MYLRIGGEEEVAIDAIKHALRALRNRHLVEEGAHGPASVALSRPFISQVDPLIVINY